MKYLAWDSFNSQVILRGHKSSGGIHKSLHQILLSCLLTTLANFFLSPYLFHCIWYSSSTSDVMHSPMRRRTSEKATSTSKVTKLDIMKALCVLLVLLAVSLSKAGKLIFHLFNLHLNFTIYRVLNVQLNKLFSSTKMFLPLVFITLSTLHRWGGRSLCFEKSVSTSLTKSN